MAWIEGTQKKPTKSSPEKEWARQFALQGFLEDDRARAELFKFLKGNISVAAELLMGVKLFPYQHIVCKMNLENDFVLNIMSRGASKTFLSGVFAGLYSLFNPGCKIGILSASFRQAQKAFQYIEEISQKPGASLFRDCIGRIEHKNDQWSMEIGNSTIYALPLGSGEKLRGFRFNCILIDELLLMPESIINEVIVPFLGVVRNPTERADLREAEELLLKTGQLSEEERYVWQNNKLIGLSSASYQFQYLYRLYKTYESLIMGTANEGMNKELSEKFTRETTASRAIVHLSYEAIPEDIFDQNLLRQALSQLSESQFAREFRSVFTDDSSGYFKMSKMIGCTLDDGSYPSIEVKGDPKDKYILSFDPSWAENAEADDFAMHLFKLNDENQTGTLVHSYAVHGVNLKPHMDYLLYLVQNFNIVMMWGDYNGGVQFISSCNESKAFRDAGIKLGVMTEEFDSAEDYQSCLAKGKNEYNLENRHYVCLRIPTSDWIRRGNESLQASIDHKRILFAGRCINATYEEQRKKNIPIDAISFDSKEESKATGDGKMIEFLDRLYENICLTKAECALIEVSTAGAGTQSFGLPQNISRQTGENRTRKDSYSALVLGNWGIRVYYDMMNFKGTNVITSWTPEFI